MPGIVRHRSRPVFEHPWTVRITHWTNAVVLAVMAASGLQIFQAFPSFGPKVPQENVIDIVPSALRLGGWLAGALRWHLTFMWLFALTGLWYVAFQFASGHYRTVLFGRRDVRGVWPMVRYYLLFGPTPAVSGQYNPLQKLAYTTTVLLGAVMLLTGVVMYKPVQFSALGLLFGGYHGARIVHFLAMCALLAFVPAHVVMVALHGWDNFASIFTGWRRSPRTSMGRAER